MTKQSSSGQQFVQHNQDEKLTKLSSAYTLNMQIYPNMIRTKREALSILAEA